MAGRYLNGIQGVSVAPVMVALVDLASNGLLCKCLMFKMCISKNAIPDNGGSKS